MSSGFNFATPPYTHNTGQVFALILDNPDRSIDKFFENLDKYLQIAYQDMLWRINHVSN